MKLKFFLLKSWRRRLNHGFRRGMSQAPSQRSESSGFTTRTRSSVPLVEGDSERIHHPAWASPRRC